MKAIGAGGFIDIEYVVGDGSAKGLCGQALRSISGLGISVMSNVG